MRWCCVAGEADETGEGGVGAEQAVRGAAHAGGGPDEAGTAEEGKSHQDSGEGEIPEGTHSTT